MSRKSIVAPYVRNAWYVAAWAEEAGPQPLARTIMNEPIVIFRDTAGQVGALENRCCHRGAELSVGEVVPAGLQCGYHGLVFDRTGRCTYIPGQPQIPSTARVKAYPVVERNGIVWIWMGTPELADESGIVEYPYHEDPKNWPCRKAVTPVAFNYMLLVDNLMDLSHVGYTHKATIGGAPEMHVEARRDVERTNRGVHFVRWLLNSPPPPTHKKALGFAGNIDRWTDLEYVAPALVLQWSGALDAGKGAEANRDQPGYHLRMFNAITPVSENRSIFFWSISHGYGQDDPSVTQETYEEIEKILKEDIVVIETQQRALDLDRDWSPLGIASDRILVHARLALEKLIGAEAGAHQRDR